MSIVSYHYRDYVIKYRVGEDGFVHWAVYEEMFDTGSVVKGKAESIPQAKTAAQKAVVKLVNEE